MKLTKKSLLFLVAFFILLNIPLFSFADEISINSKAAVLVENNTGKILYEKNSTEKMYPASTTKIMTAILVLENCNLSDIVTVSASALDNIPSGYVTCNLQVGEELSVENLMYALMVPSANDAACVLAEHVGGSIQGFSNMMNSKALEIGCTNTHFVNPNGIHDDAHYSTAYDMYLIADYAIKNPSLKKFITATEYTLPATNKYPNTDRVLKTTNQLINPDSENYFYEYAIGIKTGYTSQAGNCLVSMASRDGLEFITVTLGGSATSSGLNARYVDTKTLFNYAYDNFTLTKLKEENTIVETIEIENATKETKSLDLIIQDTITVFNNVKTKTNEIIPEIKLNENLSAPIAKGDVVGTIKYTVDSVEYTSKLLANADVIEKPDMSIYVLIGGIIILFMAISIMPKKKVKKKKMRKRK